MPRRKGFSWTPEDDDLIRSLVADGASTFRASAALKRSRHAVRERARKLGCPFPTIAESRTKYPREPDSEWWGSRMPIRHDEED